LWSVSFASFSGVIPNGITISCFGGAITTLNQQGCSDIRSLDTTVTMSEHLSVSALSGLVVTNTTDQTFGNILFFLSDFSAFNPGGPGIGISIDDPVAQAASFSSSVSGPSVGDSHGCSIGFNGTSGFIFSPTTCGVPAPDSSQGQLFIDLSGLGPGENEQFSYSINIAADFAFIPEPASIVSLASGCVLLAGMMFWTGKRRRRQIAVN
jgi:hypothetical protein